MNDRRLSHLGWWFAGCYLLILGTAIVVERWHIHLGGWDASIVYLPLILTEPWNSVIGTKVSDWLLDWEFRQGAGSPVVSFAVRLGCVLGLNALYCCWFWLIGKVISIAMTRVFPRSARTEKNA